jgi:TnpA family transposase
VHAKTEVGITTRIVAIPQYTDSHGQSEVAFAFCRLLGFELLPRLKAIPTQRLYRPDDSVLYPNLAPVLSRTINWELIAQQYDQMVKYATAMRLGTADTEDILRGFRRSDVKHPVYRALAELGKAIKTIFLCRYLNSMGLRREINEGLNVIENKQAPTTPSTSPPANEAQRDGRRRYSDRRRALRPDHSSSSLSPWILAPGLPT